jgi:hypothetical protein
MTAPAGFLRVGQPEQMELEISKSLIGQKVQVPGRADWGVGVVANIQTTNAGGEPRHRVTVRFPHGTKVLVSPPARLIVPQDEPQRQSGWLETLGDGTLDATLRKLPESMVQVLGTLSQRIAAVVPAYAYVDEPRSLAKWARGQTGVADPLSHWSRDELGVAFKAYCSERDAHFRSLCALLRMQEGESAVSELLATLEPSVRDAARGALQRVI